MFIYPIYNHNRRNSSIIYIYIYTKTIRIASNEIFSPSNKIDREAGRAKTYQHPCITFHEGKESRGYRYRVKLGTGWVVGQRRTLVALTYPEIERCSLYRGLCGPLVRSGAVRGILPNRIGS